LVSCFRQENIWVVRPQKVHLSTNLFVVSNCVFHQVIWGTCQCHPYLFAHLETWTLQHGFPKILIYLRCTKCLRSRHFLCSIQVSRPFPTQPYLFHAYFYESSEKRNLILPGGGCSRYVQ